MIRFVPAAAILALAACNAEPPETGPGAPGGWFWFDVASPAEREAFYAERCGNIPNQRACINDSLRRQALRTCQIQRDESFLDREDEDESLLDRRRDLEICAEQFLRGHGPFGLDVNL